MKRYITCILHMRELSQVLHALQPSATANFQEKLCRIIIAYIMLHAHALCSAACEGNYIFVTALVYKKREIYTICMDVDTIAPFQQICYRCSRQGNSGYVCCSCLSHLEHGTVPMKVENSVLIIYCIYHDTIQMKMENRVLIIMLYHGTIPM